MANLGKYELLDQLGSGATADVYRAHDTVLDRYVAVKMLKAALVTDASAFARFGREAHSAAVLFHTNVATVLDMGEVDGRFFIVMRYLPGQSLAKSLEKSGPLAWSAVLRLAQEIGSALDYAHAQGFLHRDVKPSNIMYLPDGSFVLTDFGLIRAMLNTGFTTTTGPVLGTPAYIAPEIWDGQEAAPASDQYALACVVYEALTGKTLFSGNTPMAVLARHYKGPEFTTSLPEGIPPGFIEALRQALNQQPAQRYPSLNHMVQALQGLGGSSTNLDGVENELDSKFQELKEAKVRLAQIEHQEEDIHGRVVSLLQQEEEIAARLAAINLQEEQTQARLADISNQEKEARARHAAVTKQVEDALVELAKIKSQIMKKSGKKWNFKTILTLPFAFFRRPPNKIKGDLPISKPLDPATDPTPTPKTRTRLNWPAILVLTVFCAIPGVFAGIPAASYHHDYRMAPFELVAWLACGFIIGLVLKITKTITSWISFLGISLGWGTIVVPGLMLWREKAISGWLSYLGVTAGWLVSMFLGLYSWGLILRIVGDHNQLPEILAFPIYGFAGSLIMFAIIGRNKRGEPQQ